MIELWLEWELITISEKHLLDVYIQLEAYNFAPLFIFYYSIIVMFVYSNTFDSIVHKNGWLIKQFCERVLKPIYDKFEPQSTLRTLKVS